MGGRVIVVSGGASGIGHAVAALAAARGESVAVLDVSSDCSEALSQELRSLGADQALAVRCDVTDEVQVGAAFDRVREELGLTSGLVCAAGVDKAGMAHELPFAQWRKVLSINLDGTFLCVQQALRQMMELGSGSIVCCSSPASFVAFAAGGASAYSASKGGVSSLVRTVAVDYARYGIRANALVPGATDTPLMWANVPSDDMPAMRKTLAAEIPLARFAEPREPAQAALWLLSDESSFVTGSHLVCDGGTLAKGSVSL